MVDVPTTPKVQYAWSELAGGANHSRLTSMTYPNGRVLNQNYAAGVDDRISRLTSISDVSATLESLAYLGLDSVVQRSHPEPGVDLTYLAQAGDPACTPALCDAGDQYRGLDRFGRIIEQRWRQSNGNHTDRFQYGYDRDGGRLYRANLVDATFSELYHANGAANGYDPLGRLTAFQRGPLNPARDSVTDVPRRSQTWTLDALGNWTTLVSDSTTQTRTHNDQNQVASLTAPGLVTPGYDNNGNTSADETGKRFVYDAWNRLVQVQDNFGVPLVSYAFDALGRRVRETAANTRDLYYSAEWQVVEEQVGVELQAQYVWSPVYVDALVARDTPSGRHYVQQDANWNVTAVVDATGTPVERYVYDPYGQVSVLAPDWTPRGASTVNWVYLHQGGRLDRDSGLYQFRNREYSASLGRWMQQDPAGYVDGLNLYAYVAASPVNNIDPSGLVVGLVADGAFIASDSYDLYHGRITRTEYAWRMGLNALSVGVNALTLGNGGLLVQTCVRGGQVLARMPRTQRALQTVGRVVTHKAFQGTQAGLDVVTGGAITYASWQRDACGNRDGAGVVRGVGQVVRGFSFLRRRAVDPNKCFAAGTPLLTPDGHKLIEQFHPGDWILSRPEFEPNGPLEPKQVEEVFSRDAIIWHLHVGGQVIRTTGEHPFYVQGKGWVVAAQLKVGDLLASHDGQWVPVVDVLDTGESETVYNLKVAEYHTYFVGTRTWGFSVWAHNDDCPPLAGPQGDWVRPKGWQLPKNGTWEGTPGHSNFKPNNPAELGLEPGEVVPFRNGRPDFSKWTKETFTAKEALTGVPTTDQKTMIRTVAEEKGWTQKDTIKWLQKEQLSLHHGGGDTVQLVPSALHGNRSANPPLPGIHHQGGAFDLRNPQ